MMRRPRVARTSEGRGGSAVAPLRGLLPLIVLLAVWELVGHGGHSLYFPTPSQWVIQTSHLPGSVLADGLLGTLRTFILSLLVAAVLGTAIGLVIGRVGILDRLFGPILEYLRFLPGVAVVPLVVLLAGYTESMKLYTVVFGSVWPVLLQVRLAARSIDPTQLEVARALRLGGWDTIRKILLPSVVPGILLGVKITAPLTLVLVLVVEIITQVSGLGQLLEASQQNFQAAQVYGLVVLIGVLALLLNVLMSLLEGYLLRYRPKA
jgi:ABC-type nitrate/sulfonate/bicarbonate transport system permease component